MTANGIFQIALYFGLVVLLMKPLSLYMAHVFNGQRTFIDPPNEWQTVAAAISGLATVGTRSKNAAIFFPSCDNPALYARINWTNSCPAGPWPAFSPAPTPNAAQRCNV
jgi:hypothetical protein